MSIKKKLARSKKKQSDFLWQGPCSSEPNGGITQSMLHTFLVCPERARIKYVLGLGPPDDFNSSIEFGNFWHCCEEAWSGYHNDPWRLLDLYVSKLLKRYPMKQQDIIHWYNICKLQFPIYKEYWEENDEEAVEREPVLQEGVFCVPYTLPSGRTVYLRGKWDAVDSIGGKLWLQENKTKGSIDPSILLKQLSFDLQTMLYLVALEADRNDSEGYLAANEYKDLPLRTFKIAGVRYNVIRRPLSGGKGSIRQKKNQELDEFYKELEGIIRGAKGPDWGVANDEHFFFMRWRVEVTSKDIENFKLQFLNPKLEWLCDWWEWISFCAKSKVDVFSPHENGVHWRAPYGTYSPLYNGKPTDLDTYLETGSTVGLVRQERLFRELVDDEDQD